VQTFCRSGEFFAFEKLNLGNFIDVCTIGKSLQMSVTLYTEEYNPRVGLVSGTFASSSSSLYVALAILHFLEAGYMGEKGKISQIYNDFIVLLKKLEEQGLISRIEGWGVMIGFTPFNNKPEFIKKLLQLLFQKGLILFSCGQKESLRLRLLPPVSITKDIIQQSIKILREGLEELKE